MKFYLFISEFPNIPVSHEDSNDGNLFIINKVIKQLAISILSSGRGTPHCVWIWDATLRRNTAKMATKNHLPNWIPQVANPCLPINNLFIYHHHPYFHPIYRSQMAFAAELFKLFLSSVQLVFNFIRTIASIQQRSIRIMLQIPPTCI